MDNQSFTTPQRPGLPTAATVSSQEEAWLYRLMLLVPEAVCGWLLYNMPNLHLMGRFGAITALFVLHSALYLLAHRLPRRMGWLIGYASVQAALIFAIVLVSSETPQPITLFLYASLAAQMVGLFQGQIRPAIALSVGFLAVVVVDHTFFWGGAALIGFLLLVVPLTAFLMALVYLYLRQMQARQEAQQLLTALARANQQLTEYAARVEDLTLAAERQRLARELHDTLAQGLAGVILQLEAVESHLGRGNTARAQGIVGQVMQRARLTLAEARRAIDDLRTGTFLLDVNDSVRVELARFAEATGIACSSELHAPASLPMVQQETILRTVSEGLANVTRHAQARQVWVLLRQEAQGITLVVRDNGTGFDAPAAKGGNGHYGLIGLCERAQLAGGTLEIASSAGIGTTLTLRLPLLTPTAPLPDATVRGWRNG